MPILLDSTNWISFSMVGGGDLTLSETSTIATVIGSANELKMRLIKYALKSSSGWGNAMANYVKWGKRIGKGTSVLTAISGTATFAFSNKSWGDYGKLGISYLTAGLTYFPEPITTTIGIGIGFYDGTGGFDSFYNYLNTNQQLYNSIGGVVLPVNGVPQFIPLK